MSRQDPSYPADQSMRDALQVMVALLEDPNIEGIGEAALRNALDGTDHTALTYNLGLLGTMLAGLAGDAQDLHPREVLQQVAMAANLAIEGQPGEDE